MKRVTISLRNETAAELDKVAKGIGCSRSALVEVLLAKGMLRHLRARLEYQNKYLSANSKAMRYTGESIREIEEIVEQLEHNYQGELWDAAD